MESLKSDDFRDRLGEFIDDYITMGDGQPIPRNIPYFRDSLKMMIASGAFKDAEEIKRAALWDKLIIIPNFLFDDDS